MPVIVNGVKELQKAMTKVDPALNKEMQKNIKAAMAIVQNKARGYLPAEDQVLSGWAKKTSSASTVVYRPFPVYDYAQARRGIIYRSGQNKRNDRGFKASFYVANVTAPGAIFETAGRLGVPEGRGSLNPNAPAQFNSAAEMLTSMKGQNKQRGRVIYRAWYEENNRVISAVVKAIDTVAVRFIKDTEIRKAA